MMENFPKNKIVGPSKNSDHEQILASIDSVLLVSNGIPEKKIGHIIDSHPFVVRFGFGGDKKNIEKNHEFIGKKTDLIWLNNIFFPYEHLKNQRVMFGFPPMFNKKTPNDAKNDPKDRSGRSSDLVSYVRFQTDNFCFLNPFARRDCLEKTINKTNPKLPTSGFMAAWYFHFYMNKKVLTAHFNFDSGLASLPMGRKNCQGPHDPQNEKILLSQFCTPCELIKN